MKTTFYYLFILSFSILACDQTQQEESLLLNLFQKEKQLNCQLISMKDSITSEWDNINLLLENNLPENMPIDEKNNMLKVRNANLIRMFQSFETVDEGVKMALNKTEQLDMEMTKRITGLKQEMQKIESEKMALFQKINEAGGTDQVARLKEIRESVLADKCN